MCCRNKSAIPSNWVRDYVCDTRVLKACARATQQAVELVDEVTVLLKAETSLDQYVGSALSVH